MQNGNGFSSYYKYELTEAGKSYVNQHNDYFSNFNTDEEKADRIVFLSTAPNSESYIPYEEAKNYVKAKALSANSEVVEKNKADLEYYYYLDDKGNEVITNKSNTAAELRNVVSKWYNSLRNIAVVLMLSILLYIGIRMLLSTLASDKAKYKQMLMDWLIGMCLLFFMHYIMAFSVTITNQFIKVIKTTYDTDKSAVTLQADKDHKMAKRLQELGRTDVFSPEGETDPNKVEYVVWPTNLLGRMRLELQMHTGKVTYIGYAICFMILVFYTVFFCFTYLKRVVYMAFLTIISPLVAMTYPIDKLNDGQAQAFNKWIKEYLFNLLIQPLHLLLYTMLVSSAINFAGKNLWYMICAIGFLIPAEKLLRSFFGFEKASTPGSLAGAAVGASLISRGVGGLMHKMPGGPHGGPKGEKGKILDSGDESKGPKVRFSNNDFDSTAALAGGAGIMAASSAIGSGKPNNGIGESENKAKISNILYKNPKYNVAKLKNAKKGELKNAKRGDLKYTKKGNLKLSKPNANTVSNNNKQTLANAKPKQNLGNLPNNNSKLSKKTNVRPNKPKRIKGALKAGAKTVYRSAGMGLFNLEKSAGKTALKFASSAVLGGFAGTVGVAAGIASGDPSNAIQYGTAGVGAGVYAGSKAGDLVTNTAGYTKDKLDDAQNVLSNAKDDMQREYYGEEEFERRQQEKQIKQWKKNKEYRHQIENKVGKEEAKEMYDNGEIDDYLRYNVDDAYDMLTMHELQKEEVTKNREQTVAVREYAQRTGNTRNMKEKDKAEWRNTFTEEFKKAGYSEADAEKASNNTFDMIEQFHKIRTKL